MSSISGTADDELQRLPIFCLIFSYPLWPPGWIGSLVWTGSSFHAKCWSTGVGKSNSPTRWIPHRKVRGHVELFLYALILPRVLNFAWACFLCIQHKKWRSTWTLWERKLVISSVSRAHDKCKSPVLSFLRLLVSRWILHYMLWPSVLMFKLLEAICAWNRGHTFILPFLSAAFWGRKSLVSPPLLYPPFTCEGFYDGLQMSSVYV